MTNPLMNMFMDLTRGTEQPAQFRRWSFLSAVAAALGRRCYFKEGRLKVYPHMYVLLSGLSATRKTTSIKYAADLLYQTGFRSFAPETTSREQFLQDLQHSFINHSPLGGIGDEGVDDLFRDQRMDASEGYICSGEFMDFIGIGNERFIGTLTNLWDISDRPYTEPLKRSASVYVNYPIINLIGGVTHSTLKRCLPAEAIDHGFMSRTIAVHADPVAERITFPDDPDPRVEQQLVERLKLVRELEGVFTPTPGAKKLLDRIYKSKRPLPDGRLQSYFGRRLDHLLKLCVICAACRNTTTVCEEVVSEANTILYYTEEHMGTALGNLGDSKNSKAMQAICDILANAQEPKGIQELFQGVVHHVNNVVAMMEILQTLEKSDRIEQTTHDGEIYYILKRAKERSDIEEYQYVDKPKWLEEFRDAE